LLGGWVGWKTQNLPVVIGCKLRKAKLGKSEKPEKKSKIIRQAGLKVAGLNEPQPIVNTAEQTKAVDKISVDLAGEKKKPGQSPKAISDPPVDQEIAHFVHEKGKPDRRRRVKNACVFKEKKKKTRPKIPPGRWKSPWG